METKICDKCLIEKPLNDFSKRSDGNYKNDYRNDCNVCKKEYNSNYYQNNKEKLKENQRQYNKKQKIDSGIPENYKKCIQCKEIKPYGDFEKNAIKCIKCHKENITIKKSQNYYRNCPCCDKELKYTNEKERIRAEKNKTHCSTCMVILRKSNIINNLTLKNINNYTSGQIVRYAYTFPIKERKRKLEQFLSLINPQLKYTMISDTINVKSKVKWYCKKHKFTSITVIGGIFDQKYGCVECKGQKPNGYWSKDNIIKRLDELVVKIYADHNIVVPLKHISNWDSALFSVYYKKIKIGERILLYYKILKKNNLPLPKDNGYYKDGLYFRGFYEFCGYVFIKYWNINFIHEPPYLEKYGRYKADGIFTDLNIYWEHESTLNKNNKLKDKYSKKEKIERFKTYDIKCQNKGIIYLYGELRNFLISKGINIPLLDCDNILNLIKNDFGFDNELTDIIEIIKKNNWEYLIKSESWGSDDGVKILMLVRRYFNGSVLDFKKYLNKHRNFNYKITAHPGSYKNKDYIKKQIIPIIKKYNRVPTDKEFTKMGRNDILIMVKRTLGGIGELRRNHIQEGKYVHWIYEILGKENTPYDKLLNWVDYEKTVQNILNYWGDNNVELPKIFNDLRYEKRFKLLGRPLHTKVSENGGWWKFKNQFNL